MRLQHLAAALAALTAFAAAGCTTDDDGHDHGMDMYSMHASGMPDHAMANQSFTFQLQADGPQRMTDHIGAHHWTFDTQDPTADFAQAGACAHVPGGGQLPGTFQVTCTFPHAGTYHVRGHARYMDGETPHNFWTDSHEVTVSAAP